MNTENRKTEENKAELETGTGAGENTTKIPITKEAEKLFSELVEKVNAGFEAGRLVRRDVASWIIARFHSRHTDGDIQAMRQEHLSEEILLDRFYKRMREADQLPPEVRKLLLSTLKVDNPEKSASAGKKRPKSVPLGGENEAAS